MVSFAPNSFKVLKLNPFSACGLSSLLSSSLQDSFFWRRLQCTHALPTDEDLEYAYDDHIPDDSKVTEKDTALRMALSEVSGEFGKESMLSLQRFFGARRAPVISTGSLRLDQALGVGGLPKGRMVEIYGQEASGKTTLALHVVAEAQKLGGYCAYLDVENAMCPLLAESIGVNTDDLLVSQPDSAENLLSMADTLTKSGSIAVIVVDSGTNILIRGKNRQRTLRELEGIMDIDEEITASTTPDVSVQVSGNESVASAIDALPLQPSVPVLIPPIAPIPSVPRPLAPLPVRPPASRPLAPNGDSRSSESDSDEEEPGSNRVATGPTQEYEISEESKLVRERHEKAVQELLMKRRAAALAVPTNDNAVRARLRRLGEPITFFGEKEMERRDRLRALMAKLDSEGQLEKLMKAHEDEEAAASVGPSEFEEDIQYPFYTEGSQALLEARREIAKYSIVKSALRLHRARRKRDDPDEDLDAEIDWSLKQAASLELECSEIGDDRPLSGCSVSHDGKMLATCSLSGVAKVWSLPEVKKVSALKGHTERATDVAFSPVSHLLATASADRTARLWNQEGSVLRTFEGHLDRLARIAFHPSGRYLGTASFDKTWRLWDVETGEELLLQEGHSRSVYGISFHRDGSLAASCGLDSLARVWDLRSGRSILALQGHVKPVLSVSFSPNGYHLATGGEDNSCWIWDLRKRKSLYIIPAHSNLISQVKFEQQEGYFLVTASYDMTAKVWSSKDFKPVKTLSGHESKVTSLDIVGDGQNIATVSHDRTIKLWSSKEVEKENAMEVE